jgi:hypothetical protein
MSGVAGTSLDEPSDDVVRCVGGRRQRRDINANEKRSGYRACAAVGWLRMCSSKADPGQQSTLRPFAFW